MVVVWVRGDWEWLEVLDLVHSHSRWRGHVPSDSRRWPGGGAGAQSRDGEASTHIGRERRGEPLERGFRATVYLPGNDDNTEEVEGKEIKIYSNGVRHSEQGVKVEGMKVNSG